MAYQYNWVRKAISYSYFIIFPILFKLLYVKPLNPVWNLNPWDFSLVWIVIRNVAHYSLRILLPHLEPEQWSMLLSQHKKKERR